MFNIEELLNSSGFQTGLGLLGASSPKNAPLLTAYQLLQARKKAEQDALHEKTKMQMEQEKTRLYGSQVAAQERSIKQQEALQQFFQQYMQGGQGGMQPQSSQPPQMPTQPQMPQQPPAQPVVEKGRHGTPLSILANLEQVESGGNPYAIGPRVGNANALGAYQFMPSTIKMLEQQGYKRFNPFNKEEARDAADFYLQTLVKKHGGDYSKALADYGGFKSKDPTSYVTRVLQGTPEKQAAQLQQIQAQTQIDGKTKQLQSVTPRYVPEFTMGSDGLKMNIKPNYEEQRIGNEQVRIGQEQQGLSIRQQQADTEAERERRIAREKELEVKGQFAKDKAAHSAVTSAADRMEQAVDSLIKHPGLRSITGLSAITNPMAVPGSNAYGALRDLESLKAKIVNDTLQAIREASRNGASGYGQFTEKELQVVMDYVTSLDPGKPDFVKGLEQVKDYAKSIRQRSSTLYEESTGKSSVEGLPPGSRMIGISGGKKVYQLPDGSKVREK